MDHGDADAVQASRHLVATAAHLPPGVQSGEDHLHCGPADLRNRIHGNPGAVVTHRGAAVGMEDHRNLSGPPGKRFVDRVIYDLVQQVVQPVQPCTADVHRRALADTLEALEHLYLFRGVGGRRLVGRHLRVSAHRNAMVPSTKEEGPTAAGAPPRIVDFFGPCRRLRNRRCWPRAVRVPKSSTSQFITHPEGVSTHETRAQPYVSRSQAIAACRRWVIRRASVAGERGDVTTAVLVTTRARQSGVSPLPNRCFAAVALSTNSWLIPELDTSRTSSTATISETRATNSPPRWTYTAEGQQSAVGSLQSILPFG